MPAKRSMQKDQTPKEFAGREQELKPHTSVTGAGETSVHHSNAQPGLDPDYGADGSDNAVGSDFETQGANVPSEQIDR